MKKEEERRKNIKGDQVMSSRKRKNNNNHNNENIHDVATTSSSHENDRQDSDFLSLSLSHRPPPEPRQSPSFQQQQSFPPPPSSQPLLPPQSSLSLETSFMQQVTLSPLQLSPSHPIYRAPVFRTPDPPVPSLPSPPSQPPEIYGHTNVQASGPSTRRVRRNPTQVPREGKSQTIPAPFPWAANRRATVHSLSYLESKNIHKITGEVHCRKCENHYELEYNLREKFIEVGSYIVENRGAMHDRAPSIWLSPNLLTCKLCNQENSAKPVIADKKKSINWLFLLLGQLIGICSLDQLKYFCKHTKNHRTGAKDRVLYLTYLTLCKQLDPYGPFDR